MPTTLEQLEKRLTKAEELLAKIFTPTGEYSPPVITPEQEAALKNIMAGAVKEGVVKDAVLTLIPKGNGATTSPVGGGSPVEPAPTVPAGPVELLPADMVGGFTLKGFDKKEHSLVLVKSAAYKVSITIDKVDGGGVYAQFVNPDGSGFGNSGKLNKGLNTFTITSPVAGARIFSVYANGANVTVSTASLTPSK